MKTSLVFLLVLIFCHLCRAQTQSRDDDTAQTQSRDDDTAQTQGAGTEADGGQRQLVPQTDVWVELRNLKDMVVEQKVELRYLTDRLTAAESLVEALEIKNTAMETRMTAAESLAEKLRMENEVQAAELAVAQQKLNTLQQRLTVSESHMEELKKQQEVQAAELAVAQQKLNPLQQRLTVGEHQVEELKKQQEGQDAALQELQNSNKVGKVAFSASLRTSGEGSNTENPGIAPLIFKNVYTNVGNHYNLNTGAFTAPVRGVYYFRFTGYIAKSDYYLNMRLLKNQRYTVTAADYPATSADRGDSASNGIVLQLEVGDVVSIQMQGRVWDDYRQITTFSGFLLFLF